MSQQKLKNILLTNLLLLGFLFLEQSHAAIEYEILNKLADATEDLKNRNDLLTANKKEFFLKYQKQIKEIFYDHGPENLLDQSIKQVVTALQMQ